MKIFQFSLYYWIVFTVKLVEPVKKEVIKEVEAANGDLFSDDVIMQNRIKLAQKMGSPNARKTKTYVI